MIFYEHWPVTLDGDRIVVLDPFSWLVVASFATLAEALDWLGAETA